MTYSEEEQVERLKRFGQDYGTPIMVGIALALAVFAGWRYWDKHKIEQATLATTSYEKVSSALQILEANPADQTANTELQKFAQELKQDYAGTPYATAASLQLAKRAVDGKSWAEAEKQLRWVLEQKPDEGTRTIVNVRLARVLAAKGDSAAALDLLAKETNPAFKSTVEEAKGDIYHAQGKLDQARTAYQAADAALKDRKDTRPPLEAKLADAGLAPAPRKTDDDAKAAQ